MTAHPGKTFATILFVALAVSTCAASRAHARAWRPANGGEATPATAESSILAAASAPAAHAIVVGTRGPILTAFFDPNCMYCHALYVSLQPAVRAGRLRIRFVLVGIVRPDSTARAASILAAADPGQALAENETRFDRRREEGGFPIAPRAQIARFLGVVTNNSATMDMAGGIGTPTLVYCSALTRVFVLQPGSMPANVILAEIASENECRRP